MFKILSFLQSKSVNNVCKLLQLLGDDEVPRSPTGTSPLDRTGDFRSPGSMGNSSQK